MAERARYLVAVALGGRLAAEIDGLRRALGSRDLERIPPHVTLVPPTNVVGDPDEVTGHVARTAASTGSFDLELGPTATFPDHRAVLFLSVSAAPGLVTLRERLLEGPFARSGEQRPFVPHVTLVSGGSFRAEPALLGALGGFHARVRVATVELFCQEAHLHGSPWSLVGSFALGEPARSGRGGLELTLRRGISGATYPSGLIAALADEGEPSALEYCVAELGGTAVGAITWRVRGGWIELEDHVVAAAERGFGIGTRLLAVAESEAASLGLGALRITVRDRSAVGYYAGRGFSEVARIGPSLETSEERVVLERRW